MPDPAAGHSYGPEGSNHAKKFRGHVKNIKEIERVDETNDFRYSSFNGYNVRDYLKIKPLPYRESSTLAAYVNANNAVKKDNKMVVEGIRLHAERYRDQRLIGVVNGILGNDYDHNNGEGVIDGDVWSTIFAKVTKLTENSGHICGQDKETANSLQAWTDVNDNGVIQQLEDKSKSIKAATDKMAGTITEQLNNVKTLNSLWTQHNTNLTASYKTVTLTQDEILKKINRKIERLTEIKKEATDNHDILGKKNINGNINGNSNASLNAQYNTYLTNRIGNTMAATVSNYKELHQEIGLQNSTLLDTVHKLDENLLENNRKSNHVAGHKDSMYLFYIRFAIVYILLVIGLFIKLVFFTKDMLFYRKIIIVSILGILPFLLSRMEIIVYNLWKFIFAIITGSVRDR